MPASSLVVSGVGAGDARDALAIFLGKFRQN